MAVLEGLEPKRVFYYFEEICKIPHGSRQTQAISDYLVEFARAHGLDYRQDEAGNIVILKAASKGAEDKPVVMIQGHMDMVCEKEEGCEIDFKTQGLSLQVEDGIISAKGTTLGGDDGIAVAYALAILEDDSLEHPPLEVVLTVDEEIGLLGATALDTSDLKAELMLNLDSEEEGHFLTGCAGGVTAICHLPLERKMEQGILCELVIDGLIGGHSGMEIDKGRGNADNLLGRALYLLGKEVSFGIVSAEGGLKDNAIVRKATAGLLVPKEEVNALKAAVAKVQAVYSGEYKVTDPGVSIHLVEGKSAKEMVLTKQSARNFVTAIINAPRGIQRMNPDVEGLVQTSLNLGIMTMTGDEAVYSYSVRSSVDSEKREMLMRLENLMETIGGFLACEGDYPGWEYRMDSPLRELMVEVFEEQYGHKPIIETMHAGVECGIFVGKMPQLDCVSYGPDLLDIHTPKEHMDVKSVERTWNLTKEVLRRLAK
ncbi:aminoacyl-histidine dipeptidase [Eubacterium oxidoreducens]|uniref:Cytosol non-specific dipeptidase n=1 Tax=Eubacterium oxidoreducens TaxID=1732 RepID=A0A1G6A6X0_EUBOX|nr:aminoacyl-histidine dipeptidase [Eubacterium oxidoreducens]SDB04119.1 dipeptidase D [Eubacterium oxidoreducens]